MSVAKSSFLFAAGTFLSRISGLIRDMVVVGVYGASIYVDAFVVAFRIPNLLREMVAEGALGNAFTKVFSTLWEEDQARARRLFVDALYLFTIIAFMICALGMLLAPQLVKLMTIMGKDTVERDVFTFNTIGLTRLLFPYLGFTIVSSIVMGALHQRGRFFISAAAPLIFNLGNIIGATLFASLCVRYGGDWLNAHLAEPKITGLAIGCLLGGLGHFLWQFAAVWRSLISTTTWQWHLPWSDDIKKVLAIMLPASIAASAGPINVFINTNFATSVGEGAVSWLNFSFRILQLPIGLFGVAVGVAVLPQLARALAHSRGVIDGAVARHFQNGVELVLWLMVPCTVYVMANHLGIIQLLFQHGKFSEHDAIETGAALYAYSFGMIGYGLIKVLTSFYYAVERTSFAMKMAIIGIVLNYTLNSLFVRQYGHVGLAMTSSIALTCNALFLSSGLLTHKIPMEWRRFFKSLFYLVIVGVLCYLTQLLVIAGVAHLDVRAHFGTKWGALMELVGNAAIVGVGFICGAMLMLKKSPRQLVQTVKELRGRRANGRRRNSEDIHSQE